MFNDARSGELGSQSPQQQLKLLKHIALQNYLADLVKAQRSLTMYITTAQHKAEVIAKAGTLTDLQKSNIINPIQSDLIAAIDTLKKLEAHVNKTKERFSS